MNGRNGAPPIQQRQLAQTLDKGDMILCPCGGLGLIMMIGFIPERSLIVGTRPEVYAVQSLVCNSCGQLIDPPFIRKATKEAS